MIDLKYEKALSLPQAARHIPPTRQDKPVHVSTLVRWILHGVRGVRLEAARIGGRWVTTQEALERFSSKLTAQHSSPSTQPNIGGPTHTAHERRQDQVERELRKIGV
jgi:hypothetical protein